MYYTVREIEERDNLRVAQIIRSCLIEYGANHTGTVWSDPDLERFSFVYAHPGRRFFVAEDETGTVVACGGVGEVVGADGVCELQRMYAVPAARGSGVAQELLRRCLAFARETGYTRCYLETLENMCRAARFYEKNGFARTDKPLGNTGHFACDRLYILDL